MRILLLQTTKEWTLEINNIGGHPLPSPLRQPIGLMTNVALEDQGSYHLEATENKLPTLVSLALQQSQVCK